VRNAFAGPAEGFPSGNQPRQWKRLLLQDAKFTNKFRAAVDLFLGDVFLGDA